MLLPHRLQLRSSRYLAGALALIHFAALASLVPPVLGIWFKLALVTLIGVSACISIRRHALHLAPSSIRELVLKSDCTVEGVRNDGSRINATISAQTIILPWLVVLLLESSGLRRKHPVVILPDSLPAEEGRILRAWLRWKLT